MAVFPAVFGLLLVKFVTGQNVVITPSSAVVRAGGDLEVLCKVDYPIDSCRMRVGGTPYRLIPGNADGDVIYFGEGLQRGECGAHIRNIQEAWNGNISCELPPRSGAIEIAGVMTLTVAKPPLDPQILVSPQPVFTEGEVFKAQCVVADGRPEATIRWFLDEEPLLTGLHEPVLTSSPGSDLRTISQNISRQLSAEDSGRTVVCRAEHQALMQPRYAKRQLTVHYPPKVESTTLTIFGLQLNAEGRLNVTVSAQPAPTAVWLVEGQSLQAPVTSGDGRISALEPLSLGNGQYNITLIIDQIRKEDVDRIYHLRVSNHLGTEEVTLRMSTMEEPAGVELDTGAIVGIVIAVLIVLIAVSLVVFAFATDRWCFAGRRRDNPKSSGESTPAGDVLLEENPLAKPSDTESAVGGKERSRLAQLSARVRAALPRGKDKVQASDATPQENVAKPAEEKVVYATLALSEQTADKPPPAFSEYAEIVYTDQGQKDAKETP